jgi:hypothetical protein
MANKLLSWLMPFASINNNSPVLWNRLKFGSSGRPVPQSPNQRKLRRRARQTAGGNGRRK